MGHRDGIDKGEEKQITGNKTILYLYHAKNNYHCWNLAGYRRLAVAFVDQNTPWTITGGYHRQPADRKNICPDHDHGFGQYHHLCFTMAFS